MEDVYKRQVHGDDNGLVLPPKIAPIQVVIVPVAQHKEGVLEKAGDLYRSLQEKFRIKLDDSENSPGWKFAQYEMQGVPLRLEIGPKDIEKNQCVLVRRDNREKQFVSLDNLEEAIEKAPVSYTHLQYFCPPGICQPVAVSETETPKSASIEIVRST